MSDANVQNKEMSNEIMKWKPLRDSEAQKHESYLEKMRPAQYRRRLSLAGLNGKTLLSYHELAPALAGLASNKRSSISLAAVKRLSAKRSLRDSLQARRFAKRISRDTADARASKDWELNLINGLLSEGEIHEQADVEEWRRFTLTGFSDNDSLNLTLPEPEPENIPLPSSPKPLEVQKIPTKPHLRVVRAVQVSEDILDEFEYPSDPVISEEEGSESDTRSVNSNDVSPISSKAPPEIKVESENWPLPSNGTFPAILSPTSPLPHPLRSNPPERTLAKSRSQQSLKSLRSNRTNRKAFVMQQNDSSLSIHSLGTTTTKSISDIESALDTENTSRNVRNKNRKFPLHVFEHLNLKRSNASRGVLGFSLLTPVAETFEKTRKGSTISTQADTEAETKGKSAQSSITERKTSRFVFQGALVRHGSRRAPGRS